MIPTVEIFTRDYNSIFDEAVSMIPRYCPEWTHKDYSDPGITLLSLFAWMTEGTLRKINQVPHKIYMALLDMLGFSIKAPQAARGVVRFLIDGGIPDGRVRVNKGAQIGSIDLNAEGLLFSTRESIVLRNTQLLYCYNRDSVNFKKIPVNNGEVTPFTLFETENAVEYILYFKSSEFENLKSGKSIIQISFDSPVKIFSVKDEIVNYFIWEYWNGDAWTEIKPTRLIEGEKQKDNVIYISGPVEDLEPTKLNDDEGYYIRAILADVPENEKLLELNNIKLKLYSDNDGAQLEKLITVSSGYSMAIDTREPYQIFPKAAQAGDAFYFAYDGLLSKPGIRVYLMYKYSQDYEGAPNSRNANKYADFSYEYFNGKKWARLEVDKDGFEDTTKDFYLDGYVSFIVPKTISKTMFASEEKYWIRIRVSPKNYAYGGAYSKSEKDKKIEWNFDANLLMPEFDSITIRNAPFEQSFDKVIAYDNFKYNSLDHFTDDHQAKTSIKFFNVNEDSMPGMYLGFSNVLSKGLLDLYIKLNDVKQAIREDYIGNALSYNVENYTSNSSQILDLQWQVLTPTGWKEVSVTDHTNKFENSGFVQLVFKNDIFPQKLFSADAVWLRVIKRNGSFETLPFLESIMVNCVEVENAVSHTDEMMDYAYLSSSTNRYTITGGNLLQGVKIVVNEGRIPSNDEIKQMRADGIDNPYTVDGDDVWVQYKEVDNFYNSNSSSRHFVVNYSENTIQFGDGVNAVSPISLGFPIKLLEYRTGGGSAGNVAAHKLQYMTENFVGVAGCDNPFPCEGGGDIETIDDLRGRASGLLKSLDRAVTCEDFEWLACEASPSVARAHCETTGVAGQVKLVIVPRLPEKNYKKILYPSRTLMNVVKDYLDVRKVIGVDIKIYPPIYRRFMINVDVIFSDMYFDHNLEKQKIVAYLSEYFSPIYGGVNKKGWGFGKSISKAVIMKEVQGIESVLKVLKVDLFDIDKDTFVDELALESSELPFLGDVNVYDKFN